METLPALWTLLAPDWDVARKFADIHGPRPVSYTHLTLPTNREV